MSRCYFTKTSIPSLSGFFTVFRLRSGFKAIRKLLSRLGCTRGTDQITSTRNGHQMMYSATCVLKSIPNDMVKSSNLFNRKISEGIPVLNSNIFQLLSLQSLLYLNFMKTEHDATERNTYNSPWINARLLWILSHKPDIAKLPDWTKFWSQPVYSEENVTSPNMDDGCRWSRVWNEVFCVGYDENDTSYGFKNLLEYSPLSVKVEALFSKSSNINVTQMFCPPVGVFFYWEAYFQLVKTTSSQAKLAKPSWNVEYRDRIWCMIIEAYAVNILDTLKTLFAAAVIAICRVNFDISEASSRKVNQNFYRVPESLMYIMRYYISKLPNHGYWLLDNLLELNNSDKFKSQILGNMSGEMKAIFYKSLFSVIEVLNGGVLASIVNDKVSDEMIKNELNACTQKVLRLTESSLALLQEFSAPSCVVETGYLLTSAIKTAVELYKSQEKNGKLRMLVLRVFQTKLSSSKQLATHLKLLVPYLLSMQESKDSMVLAQSFFDYLFANIHLDNINVESLSREYTPCTHTGLDFSMYEKTNYTFVSKKNRPIEDIENRRDTLSPSSRYKKRIKRNNDQQ